MSLPEFEAIYKEYKDMVYNLALGYVQNTADAEDIAQEVFVKTYQNLAKYDAQSASLKTWIYRIAVNQSLDFIKAKKTKKRFGFITALFHKESNEPMADVHAFDHPGVLLEDKEELQLLFALINELPDKQRTALILTRIEDRPQKEVAEIMELSVKAVESLLQRGKQALQARMKELKK